MSCVVCAPKQKNRADLNIIFAGFRPYLPAVRYHVHINISPVPGNIICIFQNAGGRLDDLVHVPLLFDDVCNVCEKGIENKCKHKQI